METDEINWLKPLPAKPAGAGVVIPANIHKRWGHEKVFVNGEYHDTRNTNRYCMKELVLNGNESTSMHFHINKHETLYVIEGTLTLRFNDGNGGVGNIDLEAGSAFLVPPGFQHQLCAWNGPVRIMEASTPDSSVDSVRVTM